MYLLGWFVSIYWGYLIVKKSKGDHNEIKQLMSAAGGNTEQNNDAAGPNTNTQNKQKIKRANNPYEDL